MCYFLEKEKNLYKKSNIFRFMLPTWEEVRISALGGLTEEELNKRLRPGGYSMNGFIASEESFLEVLRGQYNVLQDLNTDYKTLAEVGNRISTDWKNPPKNYYFRFGPGASGNQECPWGCSYGGSDKLGYFHSGSGEIDVMFFDEVTKRSSQVFRLSRMAPHLAGTHLFFQTNPFYGPTIEQMIDFSKKYGNE